MSDSTLEILPSEMRACVYDASAPHGLTLKPLHKTPTSVSAPGRLYGYGNVVVKVHSFGVNPVDAKYIVGDKLPETWMDWCASRVTGHVPGFDFSGVIVKVPEGVDCGYKVGDEVFGLADDPTCISRRYMNGSFAEYISPPLNQIAPKPTSLTHAQAAALPLVGTTAVQAFWEHGLKSGQRVLIVGASGGVGHVAVQVANLQGAEVVAVCSGSNTEFVTGIGAKTVLDYREGDIFEKIKKNAEEFGAYDLILDCVNSADSRDQAASYKVNILKLGGSVVKRGSGVDSHNYIVLGGASLEWTQAAIKRFTKLNIFAANFELFWIKMPGCTPALELIKELCDREGGGGLKPNMSESEFSEENTRKAFETLRGRRTAGKIVLNIL
ncbi:hypothetical protein TrLO_g5357 [Triparma laevis f. longispina]|uniref:Enoyl reductase (ER) domain-containing protein n=1 Tax=Triparma laevis f. longispina TaxID=1714387 RepID=A0A9W7AAA6_9STRA|nr:hypothetical protein TrLO_g5357 [Triparma laevis f. longispina]